jgi:hypothetical protein
MGRRKPDEADDLSGDERKAWVQNSEAGILLDKLIITKKVDANTNAAELSIQFPQFEKYKLKSLKDALLRRTKILAQTIAAVSHECCCACIIFNDVVF